MESKIKIGLIINPIAGMGGKVALKGTDGEEILKMALQMGAVQTSQLKAERALKQLESLNNYTIFTSKGSMGESCCKKLGLNYKIIYNANEKTESADTQKLAEELVNKECSLIIFVGGDGTARDVCKIVGTSIPTIGVPAGVKIQSSVFASNPENAGKILDYIIRNRSFETLKREVVDLDEDAYREGKVSAKLYGEMNVPNLPVFLQNMKQGGYKKEEKSLNAIASYLDKTMDKDICYIIGSGSTAKCISKYLKIGYDLLGVDVIKNKKLLESNLTEEKLWSIVEKQPCKLIVSPIGGQGFLFGRGNHQLSSRILEKIGKENIIVIAPMDKLITIADRTLHIDCESEKVTQMLKGYYHVICGYKNFVPLKCD